jgi:hypothetical protein
MPGKEKDNRKNPLTVTEQWLSTTRSKTKLEIISIWDILQVLLMKRMNKMKKRKTIKKKVMMKKKSTPLEIKSKSKELLKNCMILN